MSVPDGANAGDNPESEQPTNPGPTANPPDANTPEQPQRMFTQEELDRIIANRLDDDRKRREKDEAKRKEKEQQDKLREQGELQKLVDSLQSKVNAIEPENESLRERLAALEQVVELQAATLREGLPEAVTELLATMPVERQLEWLAKNREQVLPQAEPTVRRGTPPATRPQGKPVTPEQELAAVMQKLRGSGRYG